MNNPWTKWEDNLFSANHRTKMIANGNGTIAQALTIEQIINEYEERTQND